jgi:triosephosphate isomerase (TIM)
MRSRHLLAGNWKMNLGPNQARAYAKQLKEAIKPLAKSDVWVAPATVSLAPVAEELKGTAIKVGAQNVHWAESGAFTGETSPLFLKDLGATFTLTGHSERRQYFGETSETVAQRTQAALKAGLEVIVCFGETETERTTGKTERVIEEQLQPVLSGLSAESCPKVVLAYEPVWAIGTGKVASLKDIQDAHQHIQKVWSSHNLPGSAVILYGGSVNPSNFSEILALKEVHGALVGGASIKLDQWLELIKIAEATPIG